MSWGFGILIFYEHHCICLWFHDTNTTYFTPLFLVLFFINFATIVIVVNFLKQRSNSFIPHITNKLCLMIFMVFDNYVGFFRCWPANFFNVFIISMATTPSLIRKVTLIFSTLRICFQRIKEKILLYIKYRISP